MPTIVKAGTRDTVTGYDFRFDKPFGTRRSMRLKCMECCAQQQAEVRKCRIYDCFLWPWRMGRKLTTEEMELASNSSTCCESDALDEE